MSKIKRAFFAGAAVSLLCIASSALAGEASGSGDAAATDIANPVIQEVIVTATRQVTRLQQTPVAVTVVSAKDIAAQNLVTARDLAGQTPGVLIQRSGITPLTETYFVRGIGNSDPIFDPNVAQYVDDIYLPRAINGMTDLTDIERVEILRGPQGTLFGENADAGAIRYITRTPSDTQHLDLDVAGGSYATLDAHAYVAGPLIPGVLDASLALAHDQHDGYTYDPTIHQHVNDQNTDGVRAKLFANLTPRLTALLTLDGTLDHSASAYYIPKRPIVGGTLKQPVYGAFNPNESYASQTPKNDSWSGGVSLKFSYAVNPNLTLNSITAFRGFAQDPVNYNNDGQPLVPYSATVPTPVSIADNYIVYREHETTQEFQLLGKYDRLDFASGLYFLNEDFASNRIGYVVSPTAATATPAYPEDQIGDTDTTNYAVYAQANYHFTDKLIGTIGGRYTIEHRSFEFQGLYDTLSGAAITLTPGAPTTTPGGYAAANNFTYNGDKTWYSFTPKYGLSYQFTPNFFLYGSISKGFDAGGFNNRASSLATALPYNQENVTTYEAGIRSDWFERRLRLNATVFYNAYRGLQQTAAVISPVTNGLVSVRSNAGSAHTEGAEFETAYTPVNDLNLTFHASYLKTRFDDFPNAGTTVVAGQAVVVGATGNQLPYSPHWQLYAAANWRVPLSLPGDLKIGADISYETAYFSDVFNYTQGRVPSQVFADSVISYTPVGGHWTISLTAKNLANRIAYQSVAWGGTPSLWYGPVSPPRTIIAKVSYSY